MFAVGGVRGLCGGGGSGDSRGRAQAGACSPSTVQTVRGSSRARAGRAERRAGSSGGGKENPGLSAAHLVLGGLGASGCQKDPD
jgi:hypothetical protein